MGFPRKLLNDNEEIIFDLKPHWWFLARPMMLVVVSVAAAVVIGTIFELAMIPLLVVAGVAVLWLLLRFMQWSTTNFVLTTDRLIARAGVISKHGREIPLERINDIAFAQSIFERLLGSGDLMIESGGERGQQHFDNIRRPSLVQNEIYKQIEAAAARDADRMAGRRELSIPEQLDKLDELRQRGVISQAEFDAKKAQLLDRM